mmetsp:Transcript_13587/g.26108  ORF Transcript_13587/g.26108 Transcript_13587/m.26108 type:complete len:309 (+) Transcript_13587:1-927(+)|eukprot:CAMPEP_0114304170 /NCGR_PEP_ID=MMETSP0059-20121206/15638_1 /TAXON_ID=36894 /ORGANISM="Pyramimonas parkeae, Strain CCMP726" /LENGTH=308 /DNA_ID=CAMNT_0001427239 /DNA_START=38 /DNA_END=964 /DNA_ORIENTATION=+
MDNCGYISHMMRALNACGWTGEAFNPPISASHLATALRMEMGPLFGAGKQSVENEVDPQDKKTKRVGQQLTLEDIKPYFQLNIEDAAKALGVGLTMFKRKCRKVGIPRWPKRKLDSVCNLGGNLTSLSSNNDNAHDIEQRGKIQVGWQVCREMHEELLYNPGVDFTSYFRTLRQQCFKLKYKSKRALQSKFPHQQSPKGKRKRCDDDSLSSSESFPSPSKHASSSACQSNSSFDAASIPLCSDPHLSSYEHFTSLLADDTLYVENGGRFSPELPDRLNSDNAETGMKDAYCLPLSDSDSLDNLNFVLD